MLTGTLPQRRFAAPDEVSEPPGPRDDDVTKSESNSEASQRSTERSQDAAPSTLMAEDQRGQKENASAADADPDLEDASKTLVLFSPGDTRKSPSGVEHGIEGELATPCGLYSRNDRLLVGDQADPTETGRLSPALRFDLRPSTPITPASPPFTRVERTFVHIAETSHLNVMSSSRESDSEVTPREAMVASETDSAPCDKPLNTHNGPSAVLVLPLPTVPQVLTPSEAPDVQPEPESTLPQRLKVRSRIPVLMSEEDSGSERSSSARAQLQHRAKQLDLARLVVQKQQGQWIRRRMLSATSSSLSSGEDERLRPSETLSTTGSEDDAHTSDDSRRMSRLEKTEEQKLSKSRIPRPVTPVNRPSPLSRPDPESPKASTVRPGLNRLPLSTHRKPAATRSASTCSPRPVTAPSQSGSPRMPLRVLFGSHRSLSSTPGRTASPSPHRVCPSRQPLSVRAPTVPVLPPRTTVTMRRSVSQEATTQSSSSTSRNRPKVSKPSKSRSVTREKAEPAR